MAKSKFAGNSKKVTPSRRINPKPIQGDVAIVFRPKKPEALRLAREVADWLRTKSYRVYSSPEQSISKSTLPLTHQLTPQLGLVLALGGDGTYLRAARLVQGEQIPILGINVGSLGFLAETPVEDLYSALQATLDGTMEHCPRSVLRVEIQRAGKDSKKDYFALNDVVVERGANSHLMNMQLTSDDQLVCSLKADGIIVSSPTGSTAYNLAAGGPILHPGVGAFVVTPICPHSLSLRPMIFPDSFRLSLRLEEASGRVIVDGQNCGVLKGNDSVTISKHLQDHYVVRRPDHDYFALLREKLKFG